MSSLGSYTMCCVGSCPTCCVGSYICGLGCSRLHVDELNQPQRPTDQAAGVGRRAGCWRGNPGRCGSCAWPSTWPATPAYGSLALVTCHRRLLSTRAAVCCRCAAAVRIFPVFNARLFIHFQRPPIHTHSDDGKYSFDICRHRCVWNSGRRIQVTCRRATGFATGLYGLRESTCVACEFTPHQRRTADRGLHSRRRLRRAASRLHSGRIQPRRPGPGPRVGAGRGAIPRSHARRCDVECGGGAAEARAGGAAAGFHAAARGAPGVVKRRAGAGVVACK
jgi:hypothetical protein